MGRRAGWRWAKPPEFAHRELFLAVAQLAHVNGFAATAEADLAHIMAHEHQAPAARSFDVFFGGRVGNFAGIEAAAFVGNDYFEYLGVDAVADLDLLGAVHAVAVLHGVDDRLFDGQADAEDVVLAVLL